MTFQTPIGKPARAEWRRHDDGLPTLPLPGPIPCLGEAAEEIANDNAQRCRRSGVVIDPMFLN